MSLPAKTVDPPYPERPAEIVVLSELVYQGIFGAGLGLASGMCGLAIALSAAQPAGHRLSGAVSSAVLLLFCLVLYVRKRDAYCFLRNNSWAISVPALAVGAGSWIAGTDNQQLFYVVTLVLGVTGMAVPLPKLFAAVVFAAVCVAMPKLTSSAPGLSSTAIAALTVPTIFWLIIDRLATYMLRYNELTTQAGEVSEPGVSHRPTGRRERRPGQLAPGLRRRLLTSSTRTAPDECAIAALSARQLEIVLLCAEGLSHLQIATCLGVGPQQIRRQLHGARQATGANTSAELVALAMRAGLIPAGSGVR